MLCCSGCAARQTRPRRQNVPRTQNVLGGLLHPVAHGVLELLVPDHGTTTGRVDPAARRAHLQSSNSHEQDHNIWCWRMYIVSRHTCRVWQGFVQLNATRVRRKLQTRTKVEPLDLFAADRPAAAWLSGRSPRLRRARAGTCCPPCPGAAAGSAPGSTGGTPGSSTCTSPATNRGITIKYSSVLATVCSNGLLVFILFLAGWCQDFGCTLVSAIFFWCHETEENFTKSGVHARTWLQRFLWRILALSLRCAMILFPPGHVHSSRPPYGVGYLVGGGITMSNP